MKSAQLAGVVASCSRSPQQVRLTAGLVSSTCSIRLARPSHPALHPSYRRTFSSSSRTHDDPPSRYSKFDTSLKSDVRDSSIDPSSPTILSNIVESSDNLLSIASFSENGVRLSDGTATRTGLMIVEGQAFLWDATAPEVRPGLGIEGLWKEWNEDRFALLETISPRPEILLFGTGNRPFPLPQRIKESISKLGISLDVMDSRNAASTFNLLQEEGRRVGLALCPLKPTVKQG